MKKLRVRWKESSLEAFVERRGADLDEHRVFMQTRRPLDPGTSVRFEFFLPAGEDPFLAGTGTIEAAVDEESRAGMVLRFDELTDETEGFLGRLRDELPTREVNTNEIVWPPQEQDKDLLEDDDDGGDTFPDAQPAGFRGGRSD